MRFLRRIGIAIGSLVISWLAVSLVVTLVPGLGSLVGTWMGLIVVVLGGLIYVDILRRERPQAEMAEPPRP
jgi:hypothetical protein